MTERRTGLRRGTDGRRPPEPFPTPEEIATRAHELFVGGGRRTAQLSHYWRLAEAELLHRAATRVMAQEAERTAIPRTRRK